VNWGTRSHLTVDTTTAEASLQLLESRTTDAAVFNRGQLIGIITLEELVHAGEARGDITLGQLLAARQANSLGPFGGSPCDHRPYDVEAVRGMVGP